MGSIQRDRESNGTMASPSNFWHRETSYTPSVVSVHVTITRDLFYLYLAFTPDSYNMQLHYGVESISLCQEYLKKAREEMRTVMSCSHELKKKC